MPDPSELERQGEVPPAAPVPVTHPCQVCGTRHPPTRLFDLSAYGGVKVACMNCRAVHAEADAARLRADLAAGEGGGA